MEGAEAVGGVFLGVMPRAVGRLADTAPQGTGVPRGVETFRGAAPPAVAIGNRTARIAKAVGKTSGIQAVKIGKTSGAMHVKTDTTRIKMYGVRGGSGWRRK